MKRILSLLVFSSLIACQNPNSGSSNQSVKQETLKVQEKTYVNLSGEEQYVEMNGSSDQLPVLLFLHGGPGWPQTPHLRYFNADLAQEMIVVSWDQAGCGLSYMNNPDPQNLSVESLIDNAHELTLYLKKKFKQEKLFLLGFSYGSVIGLQLAEKHPEDYHAYIGVSQLINSRDNWDLSMEWLKNEAQARHDTAALEKLALIEQRDTSVCETVLDCFMAKYQLLVQYNGTIFDPEIVKEIEKAEHYYDDYKDYDWYEVFNYTYYRLGDKPFYTDLSGIEALEIPITLIAGRHDWNLPGAVAEGYLQDLNAPKKDFIWFEQSGHEPPEEEPAKFNSTIIEIVKENSR